MVPRGRLELPRPKTQGLNLLTIPIRLPWHFGEPEGKLEPALSERQSDAFPDGLQVRYLIMVV